MTISVIMPARNAAETIEEALDSLLAQEWADWRLVLVDDGSTDATRAIAERYAAADARIQVIDGPARGVAAARNAGLAALCEDWVLFFDADDTLLPQMMRRMMERLSENPQADAVHCGWIYTDWHGTEIGRRRCYERGADLFPQLARYCAITIHTCIFRRSLYDRAGPLDETLRTSEDFDLWQRIARLGAHFVPLAEYLVTYRVRERQTWFDARRFLEDVLVVVERGHAPDPRLAADEVAPAHAQGMPREQLFGAKLMMVAWAAGTLIARGEDPLPTLDALTGQGDLLFERNHLARSLYDVVPMVASRPHSVWFERWPQFQPGLASFLTALEARAGVPGLAREVTMQLQDLALAGAPHHLTDEWPVLQLGTAAAVRIEAAGPIVDLILPGVERARCYVSLDGEQVGTLMLPVFGGHLAAEVMKDAAAARFAWPLLGKLFGRLVYPWLLDERVAGAWAAWRERLLGADRPPASEIHDRIGWTVLLEELLGWPDAGSPTDDRLVPPAGEARVELSEPLPNFSGVDHPLEIAVTAGGAHALWIVLEPEGGLVTADRIRAAVIAEADMELARVVVREGMLGWSGDPDLPPRERLRRKARAGRTPRDRDVIACPSERAAIARRVAPALAGLPASGATVFGAPPGFAPTELGRRAELPLEIATEMAVRLRPPQFAVTSGRHPSARAFVFPDLSSGAPASAPAAAPQPGETPGDLPALYGRHFFERLFSGGADPWQYTSPYEQRKYEQTLALLPQETRGNVLEIGCAEGHFTVQLAPLVRRLHATDLSGLAIERTAERCAAYDNVSYARLDILNDPVEGTYDAIFCSELLYYMGDLASLEQVGAKIAAALAPGGVLITAHANLVVDDPAATGFDWKMAYGAKRIGDTLAAVPVLDFEHELVTPLYRIQRFRKRADARLAPPARQPESRSEGDFVEPQPDVAAHILSQGGSVAPIAQAVETYRLPILMYHAVADGGPEPLARWRVTPAQLDAQLGYLREAGFTPATFDEWRSARERRVPLPGRRVIITFDDIYADFEEAALPILQRHGFPATLFLASGRIGGHAEWDSWSGTALPLLDLAGLKRARDAGMRFGAHGVSHRGFTDLPPREVIEELWRSRVALEDALEVEVDALAYPFGLFDEIAERLAAACFYRHAVTVHDDLSSLDERDLALSRIEVRGTDDLAAFIRRMPE